MSRKLEFVAKDPGSNPSGSPTLYKTETGWIVQGWNVTDPEILTQMDIPEGESCVEIPDRLVPFFFEGAQPASDSNQ
ncbi:hypothetical protein [Nocardia sp. XZ_19_231]|uniref:hypothetical protein n=1 Tax=Nocardia sp. XZ_19_231 TaxID=2769252 RepID=UPI00188E4A78|nr:hypothetical protein [Nocardia sp. XZ_19_231]